ncbi:MAG: type II toxin-antitoxin system Phd/YefM family antitoxin [Thermoguttaceae bacterium]|jgi:antitoxin (DNA-binding transcriptional repressor) of toxin-antitoxin stability system
MTALSVTEIRDNLSDAINRVAYQGERIIVRRSGHDVLAMIPINDLALLEKIEDEIDIRDAEKILAGSGKRIPYEKLRKELGL